MIKLNPRRAQERRDNLVIFAVLAPPLIVAATAIYVTAHFVIKFW